MWLSALAVILAGLLPVGKLSVYDLDFSAYALHAWTVHNKAGERVVFDLNVPQQIVDWEVRSARADGRPALVKVLKSRRQGISTYCCARMQHLVQTGAGLTALSMGDKADLPRQWLRRAQAWHSQQPPTERPAVAASNAVELYFAAEQSRYFIASAEGKTPGMGGSVEGLHCSEVENYLAPGKMFADLMPALPMENPRTLAILESTGEMEGSYWHEVVLASIEGGDGWKLVFLPWFISPEYARETKLAPADYTAEERALVETAREWAKANKVHAAIADFRGIRPEQVAWRRYIITTFYRGDAEVFACRYPATIAEAFLGVGTLALPQAIVKRHKATARLPIERFTLEEIGGKIVAVPCDPEDGLPHWRLYEPVVTPCEYAIGADVAEGAVSDLSDERSERDYSAIAVLNRRTLATSALFHGRIEPDKLGVEMVKAGRYWGEAWIAPEVNAAGMAILAAIRSYQRVMPRDGPPDLDVTPDSRPLDRLGWRTTSTTRDLLIDAYVQDCRPEPGLGFEGKLHCLCPELAREESTFIRTRTGKREHRPGCHDDVLFAFMVALQVHRACPHEHASLGQVESEDFDREGAIAEAEREGVPPWVIHGGRDPGVDRGEEDEA
ncbi:MAG: hypothetical protein FD189_1095 [Elusimicrobia bacterium]|nr:MAG: hypothetical protein FD189_1095 [Elusimicrobiota bacterium]